MKCDVNFEEESSKAVIAHGMQIGLAQLGAKLKMAAENSVIWSNVPAQTEWMVKIPMHETETGEFFNTAIICESVRQFNAHINFNNYIWYSSATTVWRRQMLAQPKLEACSWKGQICATRNLYLR